MRIPKFILILIMSHLSFNDIRKIRQTCKYIYNLSNDDCFWYWKTKKDYKMSIDKPVQYTWPEWYRHLSKYKKYDEEDEIYICELFEIMVIVFLYLILFTLKFYLMN